MDPLLVDVFLQSDTQAVLKTHTMFCLARNVITTCPQVGVRLRPPYSDGSASKLQLRNECLYGPLQGNCVFVCLLW